VCARNEKGRGKVKGMLVKAFPSFFEKEYVAMGTSKGTLFSI